MNNYQLKLLEMRLFDCDLMLAFSFCFSFSIGVISVKVVKISLRAAVLARRFLVLSFVLPVSTCQNLGTAFQNHQPSMPLRTRVKAFFIQEYSTAFHGTRSPLFDSRNPTDSQYSAHPQRNPNMVLTPVDIQLWCSPPQTPKYGAHPCRHSNMVFTPTDSQIWCSPSQAPKYGAQSTFHNIMQYCAIKIRTCTFSCLFQISSRLIIIPVQHGCYRNVHFTVLPRE